MEEKERYIWIDNIKVFACILVAVGHFFQSMVTSGILQRGGGVYDWFIQTVYYFHVPLFFICSGFLYQKYSKVDSFFGWKKNAKKKLLVLGVPYLTFSLVTWVLKRIFAGSVNSDVNNLFYDLVIHPLSPYWYLFALFFIFLLTPTFKSKRKYLIWVGTAVLLNVMNVTKVYALSIVITNIVWFLIGVGLCLFGCDRTIKTYSYIVGVLLVFVFTSSSILTWYHTIDERIVNFLLGVIACLGIIVLAIKCKEKQSKLAQYTMPIFLMHTIFAAGIRSVLFQVGISSAIVHVLIGLLASFAGPIIAAIIMRKIKLDILYEPGKYIRIK